ncbi:glutamyl-tRNA reductase [Longirhabdus pacifica]|uniref:glutamyl-tRNA reductase n=1 Tax=Longirhabdus pacifica TaxID=2305227 RepID=UPI001008F8A5|nr:glutamyl-tRNA reductase [Longirhabdus pacifica]
MHILVVGLNYKTAPVEVREQFSMSQSELPHALQKLKVTKSILECVILATCNRTELYVVVDRPSVCGHYIRSFMEKWFKMTRQSFNQHLYIKEDREAIDHLFRVTCGLDSMVLGETQILGQMREAFLTAQKFDCTGTLFNELFKQAVTLAKRAHAETSIGEKAVSVSYAAVELTKRVVGSLKDKNIMIIGAGKMSELTGKYISELGVRNMMIMNRSMDGAMKLAKSFHGTPNTLDKLEHHLQDTDVVISSTGSPNLVLTAEQVSNMMKNRPERPIYMIDIAVPRDLDPQIANIEHAHLFDIDDLEGIVESNLNSRKNEALKIEKMIEQGISQFDQWYKTLGVSPVIQALQGKAAKIHAETMQSLFNKLPDLDERETKVIRKLTKSILNQMLHDPILNLKELAVEENGHEVMEQFVKMFNLQDELDQNEKSALEEEERKTSPSMVI